VAPPDVAGASAPPDMAGAPPDATAPPGSTAGGVGAGARAGGGGDRGGAAGALWGEVAGAASSGAAFEASEALVKGPSRATCGTAGPSGGGGVASRKLATLHVAIDHTPQDIR
jgi:hypothetical protein